MAVFVVGFLLLLAMAGYSDAAYCVCNNGVSDSVLQNNIDFACGNGADCSQIQQSGTCFNPNTVRSHCTYAVNSYYQRKGQAVASCDFKGSANLTNTTPTAPLPCVYQSSPSTDGIPTTGVTPTPGGNGNPIIGGGGTIPVSPTTNSGFGLGPTASGFPSTDNSAGVKLLFPKVPFTISVVLISGLICARI